MSHNEPGTRASTDFSPAALWASAALIAALIVFRAGWPGAVPAQAEMAVKDGGYAAMTTLSVNQEYLYIIDDRSETLLIYEATGGTGASGRIDLVAQQNLPRLFDAARQQATGRP